MKKIITLGLPIAVIKNNEGEYISLTDMAKFKDRETTGIVIANWLSTKYTIQFMGAWEQVHNPGFNVMEFNNIRNEAGSNGFILSSSKWIQKTNAIGIRSSAGRYGGTLAHRDIAFEFATWLSPEFKLYLIKENLLPRIVSKKLAQITYASEADVLNMALFGKTAKEWRDENSDKDGNIRDCADVTQLVVLANLEGINAELIRRGISQSERLLQLNQIAIIQMQSLIGNASIKKLK